MSTTFDLKVGFACNNDCIHCVIANKKSFGNNSTEKLINIIENEKSSSIVFTGGEPTIRKDFIKLIKLAKQNDKQVILQTNGRKFKNYEFAKEAAKYIDIALIAIHSHNNFVHDFITNRKGSWDETIKGIKNLQNTNEKIEIHSQTVISKLNADNLIKTFDFINNNFGLSTMNMTFPHPNGSALNNFDIVVPKYSSFKESILQCIKKYKDILYIESIPYCYIHPYVHEVRVQNYSSNDVSGLDISNSGNSYFDDDGIIHENYNDLIKSEYRKPNSCLHCAYNKVCLGVWKEYYEYYINELDLFPIKEGIPYDSTK